jgi:glycosyltransferase involved in cell wall biosynthesis
VRAVIGVSQFVLDRHAALFGDAARHVVRHPVLRPSEAPAPPRDVPTTLGYIGSLDRIKGVEALLDADRAGLALRVAGDGRLRERVERAGVDYAGVVTGAEKRAFLADCDVGIVPSVWDEPGGPPYTAVEWVLAGRPVLASRRGGLGEAVDGLPGAIAIEPTPAGIAQALRRLVEPAAWAAAVAAVGPVGSPDDLDRWLDDHERIYAAAA